MLAVATAAGMGMAGAGLAQGNVIAERRAGLDHMERTFEQIVAVVQSGGSQQPIVGLVDQMLPFYRTFTARFPADTLTPPVAQGTGPGQTRARNTIEQDRALFAQRDAAMVAALTELRAAAQAGRVTPDLLRSTAGTCTNCHRSFRAR